MVYKVYMNEEGKTVETGTFEKLAKRLATSKDEIGN